VASCANCSLIFIHAPPVGCSGPRSPACAGEKPVVDGDLVVESELTPFGRNSLPRVVRQTIGRR
jgi:hypothetical protein